jgi:hypothetical protein
MMNTRSLAWGAFCRAKEKIATNFYEMSEKEGGDGGRGVKAPASVGRAT